MKFNFNFYKILGIDDKASSKEIKAAYRELSKKFHPDNPETGNEELFKKIGIAYSILKDEKKRELYDLGQFDALEPESEIVLSEEEQNIIALFQEEFKNIYESSLDIDTLGAERFLKMLMSEVKNNINKEIGKYNRDLYQLSEEIKLLDKLKSHVTFNSTHTKYNLLDMTIRELISLKQEEIDEIRKEKELAKRMLDILRDFIVKKRSIKLMSKPVLEIPQF